MAPCSCRLPVFVTALLYCPRVWQKIAQIKCAKLQLQIIDVHNTHTHTHSAYHPDAHLYKIVTCYCTVLWELHSPTPASLCCTSSWFRVDLMRDCGNRAVSVSTETDTDVLVILLTYPATCLFLSTEVDTLFYISPSPSPRYVDMCNAAHVTFIFVTIVKRSSAFKLDGGGTSIFGHQCKNFLGRWYISPISIYICKLVFISSLLRAHKFSSVSDVSAYSLHWKKVQRVRAT